MRMGDCITDKNGSRVLKDLARDEEQHRKWIEEAIERIYPGRDPAEIVPDPIFIDVIPRTIFPTLEEGSCLTVKNEIEGVEVGITIEKRSNKLYSELAGRTQDPEIRTLMLHLSEWEEEHLKVLEDGLHHLKLDGGWYGHEPVIED